MAEYITIHPDETVVLKVRKHWIVMAREFAGVALLALMPFLLFGFLGFFLAGAIEFFIRYAAFSALLMTLWFLVLWMALVVMWTDYYLDLWIVTDKRIISVDQINLFNRSVTTLGLERIQEITVRTENALEALLHYGTIAIDTAGSIEKPVMMVGIPKPESVRATILEQLSKTVRTEEMSDAQQKLMRTVSHEVKNYLAKDAAVLAEIAEGGYGKEPAMIQNAAERALAQTRKGVEAVRSMLDTSGATAEAVESVQFDLAAVAQDIIDSSQLAAKKKGLALSFASAGACLIRGNPDEIGPLVVQNLIDNALNYTLGGSISVSCERAGDIVRLVVQDTGIGIAPETMDILFTEGGRGEGSEEINPNSTGYGLAGAKRTVEAHGGTIRAESEGQGKGSTFIVEFPRA